MDLFCENVILVHCSVVVCNYVSPFFLYLKGCHNFEIWIHSVVRLENSCLSITRAARLLDKVYDSLKSRPQNFLINCVGVPV